MSNSPAQNLIHNVVTLLATAQQKVIRSINQTMVLTYFEIGRLIVEDEQNGKERAEYGKAVLSELSKRLISQFGKGFSQRNLEQMRQFYLVYSIPQTLSAEFKLSWSHYLKLMRIQDINERNFYEIETSKINWSLRELQRQYDSALYTRLSLSLDKEKVLELSQKGLIIESA